jgi:cell division protein YceG involved in septum cleavage
MNKLPTVKSILNTPSIFEGYTFEDMVTLGRVSAEQATSTCMKFASKEYMKNPEWVDMNNIEGFLKAWSKLESQVRRKFNEAEEIASIL